MKQKSIVLALVLFLGIAAVVILVRSGADVKQANQKATIGLKAPSFELKDTTGKTWSLSGLAGKVVVVNFWASWCDSCKEENPSLQSLFKSEFGNEKFVLLSVLYNDSPSVALEYMKKAGLNFPLLIDDRKVHSAYGITGVPETFIIDSKGILVEKVIGPINWDAPDVRDFIAKLLKGD